MRPLALLLLAGCAQLVVPLYDEDPLLARHPGLRGRVVTADRYVPDEYKPPQLRWTAEDRLLSADDKLRLHVEDIREEYQIAPDGKVHFPHVGRLSCAGRRLSELRLDLEQKLRAFLREPRVELEVAVPDADVDVLVVGMANFEGVLRTRTENLRQALAFANGLSARANLAQILVVRGGKVIVCDYYHYATGEDEKQNLPIRPGDLIVVTELYDPDALPCAPEWAAIERHLGDRKALFDALNR